MGAYHGLLVIFYHLGRAVWDQWPRLVQIAVTFVAVSLAWPLFYLDIAGYADIMTTIATLQAPQGALQFGAAHWTYLVVIATWTFLTREDKWLFNEAPRGALDHPVVLGALFAASVLFLQYGREFIYFQF